VQYEFDEAKNQANIEKHGISLGEACNIDWNNALIYQDMRFEYQEERMIAFGFINTRLYIAVFVDRSNKRRIISLRKANDREKKVYEYAKNKI